MMDASASIFFIQNGIETKRHSGIYISFFAIMRTISSMEKFSASHCKNYIIGLHLFNDLNLCIS